MTELKRALLVGIDQYERWKPLQGCVNDVNALIPFLSRNDDDSPNFHCEVRTSQAGGVKRRELLESLDLLLGPGADVALLYYAGHGEAKPHDVLLVTSDGAESEPGIAFSDILAKVQDSKVPEVIVILDCCFS